MNWLRGRRAEASEDQTDNVAVAPVQAAPAAQDPPGVWTEAVCNASDKALAGAWAAQVQGDEWLAQIATRSRFAEIRIAAARRIAEPAVLKRVADASREKDKHVYRHCAESLKAHRQEGERVRRAPDFAVALHALLEATPVAISHLLQIEKDLAALGAGGEETAQCEALLEQARARVLVETQAQIDLRARLTKAEALRAAIVAWRVPEPMLAAPESPDIVPVAAGSPDTAGVSDTACVPGTAGVPDTACVPDTVQRDAWRTQCDALANSAGADPAWLAALPAARALARALQDVDARLCGFTVAIESAVSEAAQRAEQAAALALAAARKVAEDALAAQAALTVARRKASRKPVDQEAVQRLVGEFEQHLEEGRRAEAESVAKQIEQALGGGTLTGQLARRLQRAHAQAARLAGWARWGTDQAREQLIGEAEALLRGEPDIDERARAVPLLRKEWKNLDAHGAGSQGAWKRFDRALEKAYKPVAVLRAAEAAVHAAARAARTALCESWEAWLVEHAVTAPHAVADPTAVAEPDFKALESKRDEIVAAWRAAPKCGFRDERQMRKRFDAVLEKIDTPLEAARARELARREALVVAAEAIAAEADLARAMSAAKSLQRRWKDEARAMRLKQGTEQKLWQRFRRACDAVFSRRDSELDAQAAERAQREQERLAGLAAAHELEARKKEKHAARFAAMAEKRADVQGVAADALERGHAQRGALLLDLEIALEIPTPESHAAARRAHMLSRLQNHFRIGAAAQPDAETLVAQWHAIAANADADQAARMSAIVQKLLIRPVETRSAETRPAQSRPAQSRSAQSRAPHSRRDSRP